VLISGASNVTIQGNVIAYNETNVKTNGSVNNIMVSGNYMLNPLGPFPRGQNFQGGNTGLTIENNYAYSCVLAGSGLSGVTCPVHAPDGSPYLFSEHQEDSINFYQANGFMAQNNYVVGGHSGSGCGIIFDLQANNGQVLNNILSDTGQCGIGVANGTNAVVIGNKILNLTPVNTSGAGNTSLYVWSTDPGCGPTIVRNNISDEIKPDGTHSGYWNGGGCAPVTCDGANTNLGSCNTFNLAAYNTLFPIETTNPPPLIPPQPKNCVVKSPYSTQTSMPGC
jgi:hypothetical protein